MVHPTKTKRKRTVREVYKPSQPEKQKGEYRREKKALGTWPNKLAVEESHTQAARRIKGILRKHLGTANALPPHHMSTTTVPRLKRP